MKAIRPIAERRLVAALLPAVLVSVLWCAAGAIRAEGAAAAPAPPAPASPASGAWESVRGTARRVWDFELLQVGEHTLSVSQVVLTVLVVGLGMVISRLITRSLRRHLLRRVRITETAAAAVERVLFYLLLVAVVLLGFQILEIPTTLFTFLGGALAIGVGFGAQNIINNFISGLILMFEQPVRIGDLVEVEAHQGRIEEIRFRCTRIRRNDGVDVLVPNSILLEKNVINWTLSDKQIRTSIQVGVVYGSPTSLVATLIRKAVEEHGRVLDKPKPILEFQDFGDNSLVFEVYFWVEVGTMMDVKVICSDVRFRIDRLFREAGIVIAFPQRDVHLDAARPLEIRLRGPEEDDGSDEPPSMP